MSSDMPWMQHPRPPELYDFEMEIDTALRNAHVKARSEAIVGNAAVFYDWAQGDLTFGELVQIINRCGREHISPIDPEEGWRLCTTSTPR